jgi:hypothetical protein
MKLRALIFPYYTTKGSPAFVYGRGRARLCPGVALYTTKRSPALVYGRGAPIGANLRRKEEKKRQT